MAGPSKSPPDAFQEFLLAARAGADIHPINLSMAQIIEVTSPKWTNIAFADGNHENAYAFDNFLNNNDILSSLRNSGVRKIFEENDTNYADHFAKIESRQMQDKEFSDAVNISGWVDDPANYEMTSYIPFAQNAYDMGISLIPADVQWKQSKELQEIPDIYLDIYLDQFGPTEFSKGDKERILELFRWDVDAPDTGPPPTLTDRDKEIVKRFVEHSETLPQPNEISFSKQEILTLQGSGKVSQIFRSVAFSTIMTHVENLVRLSSDPDVAKYIEAQSPDEKRAIRYGMSHFMHKNDIDGSLQGNTLIVGVYKNTDEYLKTTSVMKESPHLAYMLDEGHAYATEATPPEILERIREKENGIGTPAPKPATQMDYSVVSP
ncbi:MAG TPA: hypothetical protein PKI93_00605 [Alphaproteobacteria bacterium]|nr:hypothetical protein [Alphaproteobacteria bacterium]HNS44597.1 hypothetical protein [Alphaproteobacteria bacterium]